MTTPGIMELDPLGIRIPGLIKRHVTGDWGELGAEDAKLNDLAVNDGTRIFSAYQMRGEKVWVITEADRSATTVLLPSEYQP